MNRLLTLFACCTCLCLTVVGAQASEAKPSPAQEAYTTVSKYRERNSDIVWDGAKATPEQLRAVLLDLQTGLKMLDEPLNKDLAEGDLYLRYRRFNFLMDVVKIDARLGDTDGMFQAWQQLQDFAWSPSSDALLLKDSNVAKFANDPRLLGIRERSGIADRLSKWPAVNVDALTAEQRVAGLSLFWMEARNGFVWFDHVPSLDWDKAYLDYLPLVTAATSTEDYYRVLRRFAALLHDGHSNAYYPESLSTKLNSRPPVRTGLVDSRVLVLGVSSETVRKSGLSVGDEVDTVDGIPIRKYAAEQVAPYVSSSTPQDRDVRVYGYELLLGDAGKPVMLGVIHTNGARQSIQVNRAAYADLERKPTESFTVRPDGVAVLKIGQLENDAAEKLIAAHLGELLGASGLILDLRGNGGGSSDYGLSVLSYLDSTPIPAMHSIYRTSDALRRASSGDSARVEWRDARNEPFVMPHEHVFDKPVALLLDARTFSAAEDTAAAFRLMRRGGIIGTRSGGSSGQPLTFKLPGGGSARICIKRDEYPDRTTFVGTGVIPDIEVQASVSDVRAGRDPVMDRAIKWLKHQRGATPRLASIDPAAPAHARSRP